MHSVKLVPSGVSYNSKNNLLFDALAQSIPLEHSCKIGNCGICIAEIVDGKVLDENNEVVTTGNVVTCCSKAISNLTLKANYYPELIHIK